jgi:hypothetical protein
MRSINIQIIYKAIKSRTLYEFETWDQVVIKRCFALHITTERGEYWQHCKFCLCDKLFQPTLTYN